MNNARDSYRVFRYLAMAVVVCEPGRFTMQRIKLYRYH